MVKFSCCECGCTFTEEEAGTRQDCVGEFWGAPAYMEITVCPKCKSDCVEEVEDKDDEEGNDNQES